MSRRSEKTPSHEDPSLLIARICSGVDYQERTVDLGCSSFRIVETILNYKDSDEDSDEGLHSILRELKMAMDEFRCDWIFLCRTYTAIFVDRLCELIYKAPPLLVNRRYLLLDGLLSIEAGIVLRHDLIECIEAKDIVSLGKRLLILPNNIPSGVVRGTDVLSTGARDIIRRSNKIVSFPCTDQELFAVIASSMRNAPVRRRLIMSNESAREVEVFEDSHFLDKLSPHCGIIDDVGSYHWSNLPEPVIPFCPGENNTSDVYVRDLDTDSSELIPDILHFIWLGGPAPNWVKRNINSWIAHLPNWEIRLWTDNDHIEILSYLRGFERSLYQEVESNVIKSDLLRMVVLRQFGGVYADVDISCYSNFLAQLPQNVRFGYGERPGGHAECAIVISVNEHPFLSWFLWMAYLYWESNKDVREKINSDRTFIWKMNAFDDRVRRYFGFIYPDEYLFNNGKKWAYLSNEILVISDLVLHGEANSIARHDYSHTWW